MNDILQGLNPAQQKAVLATEGPVLVLAGAGSGKTKALTSRIAYLISEKHVDPWHILAITFTNKAAAEMRERVNRLAADDAGAVWVATFHSTCVRILRRNAELLGYTNSFSVYDSDDQRTLMKRVIKKLDMDTRMYPERMLLSAISSAKNHMLSVDQMAREASGNFRQMRIADAYLEYQKQLLANDAMDFDDLLVKTVELFRDFPEVLENYRNRFRYILVDEYQDTNKVQFEFIRLLAGEKMNLCVVGDDDQSIYKFRGADITNILDFEKAFPGATVVKLEQNYRSTSNILDVANAVIAHNKGRKAKTLWTDKKGGEPVDLKEYESSYDEAERVILDIQKNSAVYPYKDTAVLYRTNAQSRMLEEYCVRFNVPYRLVGGVNFYQRKEIKDIVAYVKTVANGLDDLSVQRIINAPKRGIGQTTVTKISEFSARLGIGFYEALERAAEIDEISSGTRSKIDEFTGLIRGIRAGMEGKTVRELITAIYENSGYLAELAAERTVEAESRMENINELMNKADEYSEIPGIKEALDSFLADVSLIADVDSLDDDENRVVLMTLHGAKGLEFRRVYMCGMEEGLFPGNQSISSGDDSDMEEERRLCYVGITRAKEKLTLTCAQKRIINGETRYSSRSRFIDEIPAKLLQLPEKKERSKKFNTYVPARPHQSEYTTDIRQKVTAYLPETKPGKQADVDYTVGDRVRHVKFGEGIVKDMVEGKRDYEVTVEFDRVGVKKLFAAFAGLKKV